MIDRNLCIGLFLVGGLSHYSQEEVQKHKSINYVLMALHKKNYPLKNGKTEDKLFSDVGYVNNQIKIHRKNAKKVEQLIAKGKRAVQKQVDLHNYWIMHSKIADKAWKRASSHFDETNTITVNQLVLAILRKEPSVMKFYKFNPKKLDKFGGQGVSGHIFASSRVASKLLSVLDEEIATHNYNSKSVA